MPNRIVAKTNTQWCMVMEQSVVKIVSLVMRAKRLPPHAGRVFPKQREAFASFASQGYPSQNTTVCQVVNLAVLPVPRVRQSSKSAQQKQTSSVENHATKNTCILTPEKVVYLALHVVVGTVQCKTNASKN